MNLRHASCAPLRAALAVLLLGLSAAAVAAEPELVRDPTQPPGQARAPAPSAAASAAEPEISGDNLIVIKVDGTAYLMDRGRRLKVGDAYGAGRIARIDDNGVWLREGDALNQIPLHGAVSRSAEPAPSSPQKSTKR